MLNDMPMKISTQLPNAALRFVLVISLFATPLDVIAAPVSIMTFNVENLFDTTHDAGKNDETYLPASQKTGSAHVEKCTKISVRRWREQCLYWDWSEAVVDRKLDAVAKAIKQVNDGHGPDIIALQEVENVRILERLRLDYLEGLGYQPAVLLEGKDKRGIDVAFLSKFPATDATLHPITFPTALKARAGDTRPILEATFQLPNGVSLTGFSVHFPAPYHPTEMREVAYTRLNALVESLPQRPRFFCRGRFQHNARGEQQKKYVSALGEAYLAGGSRPLRGVSGHQLLPT